MISSGKSHICKTKHHSKYLSNLKSPHSRTWSKSQPHASLISSFSLFQSPHLHKRAYSAIPHPCHTITAPETPTLMRHPSTSPSLSLHVPKCTRQRIAYYLPQPQPGISDSEAWRLFRYRVPLALNTVFLLFLVYNTRGVRQSCLCLRG